VSAAGGLQFPGQSGVARGAKHGLLLYGHAGDIAAVRIMACQAFAFSERFMDGVAGVLLHKAFMTGRAERRTVSLQELGYR